METLEKIAFILNDLVKNKKIISQKELAERMGVSPVSVNKWLNGGAIEVAKIPQLCNVLEITPNELFGYNNTDFSNEDITILEQINKHPEYKGAIKKLLDI